MPLVLNAENSVLGMELLYDINAAPLLDSIPPERHIDTFARLRITVKAVSQNGQNPSLLVSSKTADPYYILTVKNGMAWERPHIGGIADNAQFSMPKDGYLRLSRECLYVPEIYNIFCPVNTRVTIDLASDNFNTGSIVILGKRNSITSQPYSNQSLLKVLTPVIRPGIAQIDVTLPEIMTAFHKYQFSVMVVDIDGSSIHSPSYTELLPGGKLARGIFALY